MSAILIALVTAILSTVFLLSKFLLRKNFFAMPTNVEVRPLETDRKKRKAVLKRRFRADLVPSELDAIVIGSGMGGLTCAGLLARAGKRVLVLEQHDRIGGCTHTFKTKGFEFDVGIHYVGNMEKGSMNRLLTDFLTDGQLQWAAIEKKFDTAVFCDTDGKVAKSYEYSAGKRDSKQALLRYFPTEHKAINDYFAMLQKAKTAGAALIVLKTLPRWLLKVIYRLNLHKLLFWNYHRTTSVSLQEVLDRITDNEELKAVLSYSFGDYGTPPSKTAFAMHALLVNHFLRTGGFYPVGGSSEIAYQMVPGIERNGGRVLAGARVSEILFERDCACGVKLDKFNGLEIHAPIVVSDAGIGNTFDRLLPLNMYKKHSVKENLTCVEQGVSCMQVFVGLRGTAEELGLQAKNYWVFTSTHAERDMESYLDMSRDDAANSPIPLLFASFPSTKDPTWAERAPGKSTCAIVTFSNFEWFREWQNDSVKRRGQVYDNLKQTFVDQAWRQILEIFPQLADKVEVLEGGSPITHSTYINCMHGEIYGIDHNKDRFEFGQAAELRPETACPGLYLTGQDVFTCGFIGSAMGGLLTASKILNRYLVVDLVTQLSEVRKTV